jgi:transcriptional regulator with XRE-family HTH domain
MATTRSPQNDPAIGQNVKSLREAMGYTLQDLAEYTGLSRALLTQIENEHVSPPISTLIKIANALQSDVSFFFQDRGQQEKTVVVRSDERLLSPRRQVKGKLELGYTYEALAHKKAFKRMEPFLVTFDPKPAEDVIQLSHEGEEFHFLLSGQLEFSSQEQTIVLNPGDSIYFDSEQLHGFRALGGEQAQALVVVSHR